MASTTSEAREYPVMSRQQIETLIAQGRMIVIVDQYVFKVDAWVPYHPGGKTAIEHVIGRDATDEVTQLHSVGARQMMDKFRIGRIEGRWTNLVPPIQGGVYKVAADPKPLLDCDAAVGGVPMSRVTTASTDVISRSPSPTFDEAPPGLRHRKGIDGTDTPMSVTSASSIEDADLSDGAAFLDAQTRKEIKLDLAKYPSLNAPTQDRIVEKYRALHQRIKAEGLFQCNYVMYAWECSRYIGLFGLMLLFLKWKWYALSGITLGFFWHQLVFTAHDAGHMGITHNFYIDTVIGIFIADFMGGLSLGWWKRSHNVHHIVTNHPEHDPDIELMPFFAISHRLLEGLRSTYHECIMEYDAAAKILIPLQGYSYYFVLLLGRFNLYLLSWHFLLSPKLSPKKGLARWTRWFEMLGQVVFWTWYGYGILYKSIDSNWSRIIFILLSNMVTAPLHVQITLSHFSMSTTDLGPAESFPQKMLRTTMDVDCPQWLDWFHGGLQFQAIHHLYPRIPRHNLRRAQKLVQEFCNEVDIPYALYGFVDGNKKTISHLSDVARQASILAECQKAIVNGEVHHH